MRWLTRSVVPSMLALAALIGFFRTTGPTIVLSARDGSYSPAYLVVHIGDSVAVRNDGHETHTFDCAGCGVHSGNIAPGQQRAVHFTVAGTFTFQDLYDGGQGMVGTVAVLRPGQATPAPPTPSPGS